MSTTFRRCGGYHSETYDQGPHLLPNDREHFGPGRSWCRTCYGAYAKDWRARRTATAGVPRTSRARASVMDGASALDVVLRQAGYRSILHAVARHTVFLHPSVVAQSGGQPLFPTIRDMLRRRQIDVLADGRRVYLDDNATPTDAFLWAAGLSKGRDVQFNHVWTASRDAGAYTALWNIVATPAFLAKTTDTHGEVVAALKVRAFDLYGYRPRDVPLPAAPGAYDELVWAVHPEPISDLEGELRARLRANPKSPAAVAARELGWLFSDWRPDPRI
jgi:hypothetical protein